MKFFPRQALHFFNYVSFFIFLSSCSEDVVDPPAPVPVIPEKPEVVVTPPIANFEVNRSKIYLSDTVRIIDKSTNEPVSWSWSFPSGSPATSTDKNPKVFYEKPGEYQLRLKVKNSAGVESSLKSSNVQVLDNKIPAYAGTVWLNSEVSTENDPTTFVSTAYVGTVVLNMGRTINDNEEPGEVAAYHFKSSFERDQIVDFYINPEFSQSQAEEFVNEYSLAIGRMPAFLFEGVKRVNVKSSDEAWTGGSGAINAHVGKYRNEVLTRGVMEEIFIHEAGHATIQYINSDTTYLAAAALDPSFSSTYAQEFFLREDVAETILSYLAYRYRAERIPEDMVYTYSQLIPNRIKYFDGKNFDMYPWVE